MSALPPGFGILTLATPWDYTKAIALALSLRISNPGVPIAIACQRELADDATLRPVLDQVFDVVRVQDASLRGFEHKVHLDLYSPFETTLYLDSDILVFRPVADFLAQWPATPYTACGDFLNTGHSAFGFDRAAALARLGKPDFVCIDGAGHALFRKPGCTPVFERAREITKNYADYGGGAGYADEDVMNFVMNRARPATGRPRRVLLTLHVGPPRHPAHGCDAWRMQLPRCHRWPADAALHHAFRRARGPTALRLADVEAAPPGRLPARGLLASVRRDFWIWHVKHRLHAWRKRLRG